MTKLLLLFGLLLICCSLVNTERSNGISTHQDELVVTVIEAVPYPEEKGKFPFSDYYIKLTIGKQTMKTGVVKSSNDTLQWNEMIHFNVDQKDREMHLELIGYDTITSHHCLGHMSINIGRINMTNRLNKIYFLMDNQDHLMGKVMITIQRHVDRMGHVRGQEVIGVPVNEQQDSVDVDSNGRISHHEVIGVPVNEQQDNSVNVVSNDDLEITVVKGQLYNIRNDLSNKLDYVVKLSIGGKQSRQTKVAKNRFEKTKVGMTMDDYLEWNENIHLKAGPDDHILLVELMGTNGEWVGHFKINIDEFSALHDDQHMIMDMNGDMIGKLQLCIARKGIGNNLRRSNASDLVISVLNGRFHSSHDDDFFITYYYVRVSVGGLTMRTRYHDSKAMKPVSSKNSDFYPQWNDDLLFKGRSDDREVLVELMKYDTDGNDKCLGFIKINTDQITDVYDDLLILKDSDGVNIGNLHLKIARQEVDKDLYRLGIERDVVNETSNHMDEHTNVLNYIGGSKDNLIINIIQGKVYKKSKMHLFSKPDYYVRVTVGEHSETTGVIKNSSYYPFWMERLHFNAYQNEPPIIVELIENDTFTKDHYVGFFVIEIDGNTCLDGRTNTRDLINKHGDIIGRMWFAFESNQVQPSTERLHDVTELN